MTAPSFNLSSAKNRSELQFHVFIAFRANRGHYKGPLLFGEDVCHSRYVAAAYSLLWEHENKNRLVAHRIRGSEIVLDNVIISHIVADVRCTN